MPKYRLGPIVIDSRMPLPELPRVRGHAAGGSWTFRASRTSAVVSTPVDWFHEWRFPSGAPWLKLGRLDDRRYLARFHRTAAFVIDPARRSVVARAGARVPATTIRHLLLDQIVPMLLADEEHLVIHASAVAGSRGAVAFIGPSGSGKSTLAASMARRGARLVTDDCLVVDLDRAPARVLPTYAGLRLWPDTLAALFPDRAPSSARVSHYSAKRRVRSAPDAWSRTGRPHAFRAAVILASPEERRETARLDRLHGHEAFAAVLRCTFHLDIERRETSSRAFERVSALLATVPVYRLQPPDDLSRIDDARRLVQPLIAA